MFQAGRHPDVRKGRRTADAVLQELKDQLCARAEEEEISMTLWEDYYADISVCIAADADFANLLRDIWNLNAGGTAGAAIASLRASLDVGGTPQLLLLRRALEESDADGDGEVTLAEFSTALLRAGL